jgi:AbrB family looped-hinge helix DNA binding protein
MAATVTSKGQVTIPKRVRDQLGLKAGSRVEFVLGKGHALIAPAGRSDADALAGSLRAYAGALGRRPLREVLDEVRKEVAGAALREGLPPRRQRRP